VWDAGNHWESQSLSIAAAVVVDERKRRWISAMAPEAMVGCRGVGYTWKTDAALVVAAPISSSSVSFFVWMMQRRFVEVF
jgi:hypothetical protein